ncbi:LOW QUALITY PROTEIN: hypothetical protein Cgig2_021884 [Carnegiea gigantea]|uniref:Reverse transcriptase zinc-binding domain-containing protein n=1 Tax=Carnegiea gigantea TaxID=171969 RepID=A0A9Q1JL27_9CARY|nr:LOW QUALITY PROTEIN: hypothetical protein Cgig2_021884 [Carnegiea gigantea]
MGSILSNKTGGTTFPHLTAVGTGRKLWLMRNYSSKGCLKEQHGPSRANLYTQSRLVTIGYWRLEYKGWSKVIWAKAVTPRHAFIIWMFMHQRLPVRCRLARFTNKILDKNCAICNEAKEDFDHLFFQCKWAKEFWQHIRYWWHLTMDISNTEGFTKSLLKINKPRGEKSCMQLQLQPYIAYGEQEMRKFSQITQFMHRLKSN